jgi:hypothetical protein
VLDGRIVPETKFHLTNAGDPIEYYIYLGYHSVVWRDPDGSVQERPAVRADANTIGGQWANELEQAGFIQAACDRFADYDFTDRAGA